MRTEHTLVDTSDKPCYSLDTLHVVDMQVCLLLYVGLLYVGNA